jgi:hypothetical protein
MFLATPAALVSPISVATHFTQQNGIMGIVTGVDLARAERLSTSSKALRCRRKFLGIFRSGFRDETYLEWERNYKWEAHRQWETQLDRAQFQALLRNNEYAEIAARAVRIESRTNLIFSFEKMALRDAVRVPEGAWAFATGLYTFLHGSGDVEKRFERWCEVIGSLPRTQTRVLTWPLVTVFGFLAQPERHIFLKPNVTRAAAENYGFDFRYGSKPSWSGYANLLKFASVVRRDLRDLRPRDMIDIQSFIWVLGSDEYS